MTQFQQFRQNLKKCQKTVGELSGNYQNCRGTVGELSGNCRGTTKMSESAKNPKKCKKSAKTSKKCKKHQKTAKNKKNVQILLKSTKTTKMTKRAQKAQKGPKGPKRAKKAQKGPKGPKRAKTLPKRAKNCPKGRKGPARACKGPKGALARGTHLPSLCVSLSSPSHSFPCREVPGSPQAAGGFPAARRHSLFTNSRHARIHHPPGSIQVACARLKHHSKDPSAHQFSPCSSPPSTKRLSSRLCLAQTSE